MPEHELPGWAATFQPRSWVHLLSLIWTIGPIVLACRLGRSWLARGRIDLEQRLAAAWGGFAVCTNIWSIVYWHLPDNFKPDESLPIQLCDLACMLAPLVLLTDWRWPRALVFFWGLGLSTQAFFTPTVLEGPAHMKYYLFWLVHLVIVGTAVYDLVVRRYRPTIRDLVLTIAAGIVYLLAMLFVNDRLDSNYGFVGNKLRQAPTLVDRLGPWPDRVFMIAGIAVTLFVVMWLAVTLIDRAATRGRDGSARRGRRSEAKRPAILHCSKCGFDLTTVGQPTDDCPGCGTPITPPGV